MKYARTHRFARVGIKTALVAAFAIVFAGCSPEGMEGTKKAAQAVANLAEQVEQAAANAEQSSSAQNVMQTCDEKGNCSQTSKAQTANTIKNTAAVVRAGADLLAILAEKGEQMKTQQAQASMPQPQASMQQAAASMPQPQASMQQAAAMPLQDALCQGAFEGDIKMIGKAFADGVDINGTTTEGFTALMCASQGGRASVVDLLLQSGANINATTKDGITALKLAEDKGHVEVVKVLKAAGASG